MPQQRFRLLHISDLHLASRPNMVGWQTSIGSRSLLARVLRQHKQAGLPISAFTGSYDEIVGNKLLVVLNSQLSTGSTDAILITGDIATVGTKKDIQAALDWFSGDNGAGVSLPATKLFSMPGNHDRFFGKLPLYSGSKRFEYVEAFGPRWNQTPTVAPRPEAVREYRLENLKGHPGLSVICADFALSLRRSIQRSGLHFDDGIVDAQTLDALAAVTSAAMDEGQAVVWAIHFPPNFPGEIRKRLRGYRRLLEHATALGVRHIFAGHTHKQVVYRTGRRDAPINVYCAGTAMCDGAAKHSFLSHTILTLDGEVDDVSSDEYVLSQGDVNPSGKGTWHNIGQSSQHFHSVRLPWLSRFGY